MGNDNQETRSEMNRPFRYYSRKEKSIKLFMLKRISYIKCFWKKVVDFVKKKNIHSFIVYMILDTVIIYRNYCIII